MSATFFVLGLGSAFPTADDEAEKPEMELTGGLGLLKMLPPTCELVGRQYPGCLRFGQGPVQETMRERVIDADGVRDAGDLGQPGGVEQPGQAAPDPPIFYPVTERLDNLPRRLLVRTVDEHRIPIEVKHHNPPARAHDAHHLRQRLLGGVEMHEHALRPAAVERGIRKRERLCVSFKKFYWQPQCRMPVLRLSDHRAADVHPDNPPARANQWREVPHVITRSTPDIEQAQAVAQLKLREHHPLHLLDVLESIPRIEERDEEA